MCGALLELCKLTRGETNSRQITQSFKTHTWQLKRERERCEHLPGFESTLDCLKYLRTDFSHIHSKNNKELLELPVTLILEIHLKAWATLIYLGCKKQRCGLMQVVQPTLSTNIRHPTRCLVTYPNSIPSKVSHFPPIHPPIHIKWMSWRNTGEKGFRHFTRLGIKGTCTVILTVSSTTTSCLEQLNTTPHGVAELTPGWSVNCSCAYSGGRRSRPCREEFCHSTRLLKIHVRCLYSQSVQLQPVV